jgi:hypothetical protein
MKKTPSNIRIEIAELEKERQRFIDSRRLVGRLNRIRELNKRIRALSAKLLKD